MDSGEMSTRIEKQNGDNFYAWKQKIKHLLAFKDLDEFIEAEPPEETDATHGAWKRKEVKAQAIIGPSLSDDMLGNTREVQTTKQMWKKICDVFERHTLLNKLLTIRPLSSYSQFNQIRDHQFIWLSHDI